MSSSLLIGLALTGVAAQPAPQAALPDEISVEFMSWGARIDYWSIAADGSGTYHRVTEPRVGAPDSYAQEEQASRIASPSAFRDITGRLAGLRQYLGQEIHCEPGPTDQPYTTIRWRTGRRIVTLSFSFSCAGAVPRQIGKAIMEATRVAQAAAGLVPGDIGPGDLP